MKKTQNETLPANIEKGQDVFNTLNAIDARPYTETKNGLTYLSWAWAWGIAKKLYPQSFYTVYENAEGWNYFTDGRTCWVKTGVTIVDGDWSLEHIEYLPVMNHRNASIPQKDVTSFDINKAIQRSLTKAIARHGLGLYIYAGEDLPEAAAQKQQEEAAAAREVAEQINGLIIKIDGTIRKLVTGMDKDAKAAFANEMIVPVIGSVNYKICKDPELLATLLAKLQENSKAA